MDVLGDFAARGVDEEMGHLAEDVAQRHQGQEIRVKGSPIAPGTRATGAGSTHI